VRILKGGLKNVTGNSIAVLALAACASFAWGQAPAPGAGPLVQLNVVALDSDGKPVGDLTADDFKVSDQGAAQRIVFLHKNLSAAPAASAGEVSNRPSGAVPHSTAILFDLLNVDNMIDRNAIWHNLSKWIPQMESGESVYFYLLTVEGNLTPLHPVGSAAAEDKTWHQEFDKLLDKTMKGGRSVRPAGISDEDVVKKTYVALETVGNQLATLPGRRDILWITNHIPSIWKPGVPCNEEWVECALYVPHLSFTLDKAKVQVNPVSYTSTPNPTFNRNSELMAGLTGARPYYGEDIRKVVAQVVSDAANSYTLYYETQPDKWDNKFHKVKVTCERKGVKLQTRHHYYALPDTRPLPARQQAALVAAFQSVFDTPDLGLSAMAAPAAGGQAAHLQIRVNVADLLLRETGGSFDGQLTIVVADYGAAGLIGTPGMVNFNIHMTREQRDAALKGGVPVAQDHPLPAGIQKVRVLVLDQGSSTVGSVTIPIKAS
jgi:VWFA-related protein